MAPGDRDEGGVPAEPTTLRTSSPSDTRAVARVVAATAQVGDVVLLAGDLGAGKTAFAQGFGRALGIEEPITSPTFTLVRTYAVPPGHSGLRSLLHADVYRLDHLHEIVDLGLGQLVEDGGVALVEWGDLAVPVLGEGALLVQLTADEDDESVRHLVVRPDGARWEGRWAELTAALSRWREGSA